MHEHVFENSILLIGLLTAHLIADFYMQPYAWVESRNKKHALAPQLYFHSLLHGLLAGIAFFFFSAATTTMTIVCGSMIIAASHFFIDLIKSYSKQNTTSFLLDQMAHIAITVSVYLYVTEQWNVLLAAIKTLNAKHFAIVMAYLAVLKPCSIVIRQLLSPWTEEVTNEKPERKSREEALSLNLEAKQTLALAGQRIGYLERTLMLTFILLNQFSAIGFLIAAKSIFRFGDLTKHQDRKLTEYVLLGTLTSVVITLLVGLACAHMVGIELSKVSN